MASAVGRYTKAIDERTINVRNKANGVTTKAHARDPVAKGRGNTRQKACQGSAISSQETEATVVGIDNAIGSRRRSEANPAGGNASAVAIMANISATS